jgi:hypothetical protein
MWARKRKTPFDVREFDPRIEFAGRQLGFHYIYHPRDVWAHTEADEEGFSTIFIGGRWRRQPCTQCHMTMCRFHDWLETGRPEARQQFLGAADLLLKTAEVVELAGRLCYLWTYDFQMPTYAPHPAPWISCLSQSWAISVFCRAYQMTGRDEFLVAARGAMATYSVPVADGGLLGRDQDGHIYYEEYPFPGKDCHVLNGFLSSLMGLYDLYRATGDEEAKRLFDEGIATVAADGVLERYDLGYCSVYDQSGARRIKPAYTRYNLVHVRQLLVLYRITGIEKFREFAERWFSYSRRPACRARCLFDAVVYRLQNIPRYVREAFARS